MPIVLVSPVERSKRNSNRVQLYIMQFGFQLLVGRVAYWQKIYAKLVVFISIFKKTASICAISSQTGKRILKNRTFPLQPRCVHRIRLLYRKSFEK